jgi:NADPH-dependent ferric siderophore reductase
MKRIVLSGDDLEGFPVDQEGAHVKVVVPQPGEQKPKINLGFSMKKFMRSYTIRYFDSAKNLLTIDFAVNDHVGVAANWAMNAKVGDYLGIAGPGPTKYTDYFAPWHLLVADLTALPALAVSLEKMPLDAVGYGLVQVPSEQDIQDLQKPEGIDLKWVINSDLTKNALLDELKLLQWKSGSPAIFIAAGSSQVKSMRDYVKNMPDFSNETLYASGYWKS